MASSGSVGDSRATLPPNTDESTSIAKFAAGRFAVDISDIESGVIGERIHLFWQEHTDLGPQPVFFSEAATPLEGLNVDTLPASVGLIYVQASAFLVFNGNEWFGRIYGSDTTMIESERGPHDISELMLADTNFYEDPATLEIVEFNEYHVAFVDADEIGIDGASYLLHYHKISGQGDGDFSNDVWDFGSLSGDSTARTTVVEFLRGSAYEFTRAEASSTNDVYILIVPMERITLLPGESVLVTISVDGDDLVGEIYTGSSITDPAAVRYTLDPILAPISFGIVIE